MVFEMKMFKNWASIPPFWTPMYVFCFGAFLDTHIFLKLIEIQVSNLAVVAVFHDIGGSTAATIGMNH